MFNKITFDDYDLEYIKGRQEARVNQDVKEEWVCSLLNQWIQNIFPLPNLWKWIRKIQNHAKPSPLPTEKEARRAM